MRPSCLCPKGTPWSLTVETLILSLLSSPGDWLTSVCHHTKSNTYCPRSTVSDKNHTHLKVYRASYVGNIGDKMLRGMNSGLYFQTNKVLLFGEVLILKPKKKHLFVWTFFCGTTRVWKDFVLVLLLCRQFLVVERTVILFSYWMKCLVWMLFIWEDILYMAYFLST